MSRLATLQQAFQQCVLQGRADPAPAWLSADGRAPPTRQLAAYQHAYRARLMEVLAGDYPAVTMAIGEPAFESLAEAYIDTHPSRSFSLRDFGAALAGFVATSPHHRDHPWLAELASFEWALAAAFDAADAPLATEDDLAAIPPTEWPALQLTLHPSAALMMFNWDAPMLWSALTADTPQAITATRGEPAVWLIWRERAVTRFRSLDSEETDGLTTLAQGGTFADLCETLARLHAPGEVPWRAASWLRTWLAQGLIQRATARSTDP